MTTTTIHTAAFHTAAFHTAHRLLTALLALAVLAAGCGDDTFTGSEVILEFGTASGNASDATNQPDEHYEVFILINEGLVSVGSFRIEPNLDATAFPSGEKIGVANKIGAGLPESGIEFRTPANLEDATGVLITIEDNGETDLSPSARVVARGTLGPGPRSTLKADLTGEVPTLFGTAPLVGSRITILLTEDRVYF